MDLIIDLLIEALNIYLWLIIASAVASWLVAFGVLNMRNKWVYKAYNGLDQLVDPALKYVRKVVPPAGGVDFSPMVMFFVIYVAEYFLNSLR